MKISVVLEKKSRFNIDLSEPEAKGLYKKIVGSIVEALKPHQAVIKPTVRVNRVTPNEKVQIIEKPQESEIETIKSKQIIAENKEVDMNSLKKLIMVKCPSCGEIATPVLYVKDGEIMYKNKTLKCKHCQGELPIGELKPAKYSCPNCGTKASFYVMGDLKEVYCRDCKSVIDLIWNDKKKQYMSVNLIK